MLPHRHGRSADVDVAGGVAGVEILRLRQPRRGQRDADNLAGLVMQKLGSCAETRDDLAVYGTFNSRADLDGLVVGIR
jgi:hypothetical protein